MTPLGKLFLTFTAVAGCALMVSAVSANSVTSVQAGPKNLKENDEIVFIDFGTGHETRDRRYKGWLVKDTTNFPWILIESSQEQTWINMSVVAACQFATK